ncbi:M23 family metallopeptidase [Candidatus Woesearchaeota archaeon]|nr:M23 family metallopeptidase [Candidatus Woesearchaeota archaeon]
MIVEAISKLEEEKLKFIDGFLYTLFAFYSMARSKYKYGLPFRKEAQAQAVSDTKVHYGKLKFAIDFVMPEDSPVLAARDGIVVDYKKNSKTGGNDPKLANEANYITLQHEDNEFSQYVHLKHQGILVKKGQTVQNGQVIGLSGNTGYSTEPHLHFVVFQRYGAKEEDWESIEIEFE